MSTVQISPQDMSDIYTTTYCVYACGVLLVYDWLLCFGKEVKYIWKWHSRVTISTVVYAVCRCAANQWTQVVTEILAMIAIWAFSGLRAYALSSRALWLTTIIILWMLPPTVIFIPYKLLLVELAAFGPFEHDIVIELLAVVVTWWYSFQSYRIRKGTVGLGKSLSSLLIYNGSTYFLFLASLYIFDIIVRTAPVPESVAYVTGFMELFYDPLASILVCRFMLSLRQFDASVSYATELGTDSRLRDHTASTVLRFGAQPSESLPALIAPFAHPVHVDWSQSETEPEAVSDRGSEWRETDVIGTETETLRSSDRTPEGQLAKTEHSA
ncbi:hypothetical protein GSI_04950 [Ganoderma sinense ZZ0214-1]|uniref:DUF6533 domain-containing protein n=1 Tax=Ganoderma sinense ZZ0214-1 TaxID=1077348 RepID=A0A2G8SGE9_9APHY|nr:hypothetical protein GSI_04950 [Ganoderma sinense ZZ0214-1]